MKILILTVESWNSKFGANTFSSIFQNVTDSEYANICIRDEIPDSDFCKRYFSISESKILRSVFFRNTKTGKEVFCNQAADLADQKYSSLQNKLYNKNRLKRSYTKLIIRELFWKLGVWKTNELKTFLSDFNPDLVVYEMSGYLHFNRLCRFIVEYTGAKSIGYFWDDNFTYKQRKGNPGFYIFRFLQRISLKKLAKHTNSFWAITEKTKDEADLFFNINSTVLTKPIFFEEGETFNSYNAHNPIQMLYIGNLMIGRWDSIKLVSQVIDRINENGEKIRLDIYTASYIPPKEKNKLSSSVCIHDSISQKQAIELQKNTDILLFVEAVNSEKSQITRLSFSTKLTEYLHCGRCILAIGNSDIAPIEYLKSENAAFCVSTSEELYRELKNLTENPEIIAEIAKRAYDCGKRNHSSDLIKQKVIKTIEKLVDLSNRIANDE